jgi:hypothetical protein
MNNHRSAGVWHRSTVALGLTLLLLPARFVLAAPNIPAPPVAIPLPPLPFAQPPCISTGALDSPATSVYVCSVHNAGIVGHRVTVAIRNEADGNVTITGPITLAPGTVTKIQTGVTATETQYRCIVTTTEAPSALQDLAVVLQIELQTETNEGIIGIPSGETEGSVFPQCAPASQGAPANPS